MNTVLVRYGHSLCKKQYTKKNQRKICSESRDIDGKQNRVMTRRSVRHFPPASDRMTPNSVCL